MILSDRALGAHIAIHCRGGRCLKVDAGIDTIVLQALIRSVEAA